MGLLDEFKKYFALKGETLGKAEIVQLVGEATGVSPEKAPSFNLGAPATLKTYYGGPGTYTLNGVQGSYPDALNVFFWDKNEWDVLGVPIAVPEPDLSNLAHTEDYLGYQLFDKSKLPEENKGFYMESDGDIIAGTAFFYSQPIKVKPNTRYRVRSAFIATGARGYAVMDSGMNIIPGGQDAYVSTIDTGPNVEYVVFSGELSGLEDYVFNEGPDTLPYIEPQIRIVRGVKVLAESIEGVLPKDNIPSGIKVESVNIEGEIKAEQIEDAFRKKATPIAASDLSFAKPGVNVLNWKDPEVLEHRYIVWQSGLPLQPSPGATDYTATGWIAIPEGQTKITTSYSHQMAFYGDKSFESYIQAETNLATPNGSIKTYDVPAGAKYYRQGFPTDFKDSQMIVFGEVLPEEFVPPLYVLEGVTVNTETTLELIDIKEICIAEGRTIELYNSQVTNYGNKIQELSFFWSGCGSCMKRKWTMKGTAANIGNYTLTLRVYDKDRKLLKEKEYPVRVVSDNIASSFSICPIGDSLTNYKPWQQTLIDLSDSKISLVGTRWGNGASSIPFRHEGRSGASSNYYIGNNSYTFDSNGIPGNDGRAQNFNPFWNPNTSQVDFNYYKSNYNVDPGKLLIWLGTNGISVNPNPNAERIKTFIDRIRSTGGATIPIFVVHTLFRGDQNGLGKQTGNDGFVANAAWKLEEDIKVFNLHQRLHNLLRGYANVYLVPVSTCHDSEFNFGSVPTPVNPHAVQTEEIPVEATHPQQQGYLQIADVIFSSIAGNQ